MLTDEEIFNLAYESYNEDAGPLYPDCEIRQSLMEDLKPFLILFARKLEAQLSATNYP